MGCTSHGRLYRSNSEGREAADLPVEQRTKFEMAPNLKPAKSPDLVIPPAVPALASDVIKKAACISGALDRTGSPSDRGHKHPSVSFPGLWLLVRLDIARRDQPYPLVDLTIDPFAKRLRRAADGLEADVDHALPQGLSRHRIDGDLIEFGDDLG